MSARQYSKVITSFNIPSPKPGQGQVSSGYPQDGETPSDYFIPPCEIADVDEAVFTLFDSALGFSSMRGNFGGHQQPISINKPFVTLAGGERYAYSKRSRPIRDSAGALILPAISIKKTTISYSDDDVSKMGINQFSGEIVIKRKPDPTDRDYQNFLNKLALKNRNVFYSTRRGNKEGNRLDATTQQGMLLAPHIADNLFEFVAIPSPKFYTTTYDIVFWTSYTEHMNYLIETMLHGTLPQTKGFYLKTDKGYWFVAHLEDSATSQDNFDDYTEEERLIRYQFTLRVPAYLLVGRGPGNPIPVKKYFSFPEFEFDVREDLFDKKVTAGRGLGSNIDDIETNDKFVLTDVSGEEADGNNLKNSQQPTTLQSYAWRQDYSDPRTGRTRSRFVKIMTGGEKKGETWYTASDPGAMEEWLDSLKERKPNDP